MIKKKKNDNTEISPNSENYSKDFDENNLMLCGRKWDFFLCVYRFRNWKKLFMDIRVKKKKNRLDEINDGATNGNELLNVNFIMSEKLFLKIKSNDARS